MKKHKGMGNHTGPIHHADPLLGGMGGKDPHASAEHHKANTAHGMHAGMSPTKECCDGDLPEEGGRGMSSNYSHE
jgi:hypothetical protein